jgi:hypothetical protein
MAVLDWSVLPVDSAVPSSTRCFREAAHIDSPAEWPTPLEIGTSDRAILLDNRAEPGRASLPVPPELTGPSGVSGVSRMYQSGVHRLVTPSPAASGLSRLHPS